MVNAIRFIFIAIAIVTTTNWAYQNMGDMLLIDGITVSAFTVTIIAIVTSTSTWVFILWARNKDKIFTFNNIALGMLSGYVLMSPIAGWVGPMAAIIVGIVASTSLYMVFSPKNKEWTENATGVIIRGIVWTAVVYVP